MKPSLSHWEKDRMRGNALSLYLIHQQRSLRFFRARPRLQRIRAWLSKLARMAFQAFRHRAAFLPIRAELLFIGLAAYAAPSSTPPAFPCIRATVPPRAAACTRAISRRRAGAPRKISPGPLCRGWHPARTPLRRKHKQHGGQRCEKRDFHRDYSWFKNTSPAL